MFFTLVLTLKTKTMRKQFNLFSDDPNGTPPPPPTGDPGTGGGGTPPPPPPPNPEAQ